MYSIIEQSGTTSTYVTEYIVDTVIEIQELPKMPKILAGSSCIVLENSSVYMLGNDNEWHEI